jgi:hypothetical protein
MTPTMSNFSDREAIKNHDHRGHTPQSSVTRVASWITSSETPTLDNGLPALSIMPVERLGKLGERTRAMNLYRSFMVVVGCREAMWEELKILQRSRRKTLVDLGWENRLLEDKEARSRFDGLFEQFESYVALCSPSFVSFTRWCLGTCAREYRCGTR